jgi:hypothetical protein
MIKYQNGDRNKLKQMQKLYGRLEDVMLSLTDETKELLSVFHNYEGSIPYSIDTRFLKEFEWK